MQSYWSNPPAPYGAGWRQAPVPGWGANPDIVGPRYMGIGKAGFAPGAIAAALAQLRAQCLARGDGSTWANNKCVPPMYSSGSEGGAGAASGFPWIYVFAGAAVLGAGALFAYKKGYIG